MAPFYAVYSLERNDVTLSFPSSAVTIERRSNKVPVLVISASIEVLIAVLSISIQADQGTQRSFEQLERNSSNSIRNNLLARIASASRSIEHGSSIKQHANCTCTLHPHALQQNFVFLPFLPSLRPKNIVRLPDQPRHRKKHPFLRHPRAPKTTQRERKDGSFEIDVHRCQLHEFCEPDGRIKQ